MKEIGPSDLWDYIIDNYCDSKEKDIISELADSEYDDIEFLFGEMIEMIEIKISKNTKKE